MSSLNIDLKKNSFIKYKLKNLYLDCNNLFYNKNKLLKFIVSEKYEVNFGPQHPAAHGVLRLIFFG